MAADARVQAGCSQLFYLLTAVGVSFTIAIKTAKQGPVCKLPLSF